MENFLIDIYLAIIRVFRLSKPSNLDLFVSLWAIFKITDLLDQSEMKDDDTRAESFCSNLVKGVSS